MSQHHDGINDELMRRIAQEFPDLGATGRFPQGKLTPSDEGELRMAIGTERGKIIIHFGKEVAWIAFGKKEALDLAQILTEKAAAL